jgi:hypothetical protein
LQKLLEIAALKEMPKPALEKPKSSKKSRKERNEDEVKSLALSAVSAGVLLGASSQPWRQVFVQAELGVPLSQLKSGDGTDLGWQGLS